MAKGQTSASLRQGRNSNVAARVEIVSRETLGVRGAAPLALCAIHPEIFLEQRRGELAVIPDLIGDLLPSISNISKMFRVKQFEALLISLESAYWGRNKECFT
ncbi:MAG: hypothetical protein AAF429_14100 [Pseudomonadota bacterium]